MRIKTQNNQNNYQPSFQSRSKSFLSPCVKTIESVGTFNHSTPTKERFESFEKSLVRKRDYQFNPFILGQEPLKQISPNQNLNRKLQKIQSQVISIAQMKQNYQNRMNKDKSRCRQNKSMDKSSAAKSIDKHVLKPTTTPSFSKLPSTQISQALYARKTEKQNNLYEQNQNKLQKKYNFLSSEKKSFQNCSYRQSRFQEYEMKDADWQESSTRNKLKSIQTVNGQRQDQVNREIQIENKSDFQNKFTKLDVPLQRQAKVVGAHCKNINENPLQQVKKQLDCKCEEKLQDFIQDTTHKMSQILVRLGRLQKENVELKKFKQEYEKSSQENQILLKKLSQIEKQNDSLKESNISCSIEKEQLQGMLKEILFQREKEKLSLAHSRQNSSRYAEQQSENYIGSSFVKKSHKQLKESQAQNRKFKVNNILQKLQIKVENI